MLFTFEKVYNIQNADFPKSLVKVRLRNERKKGLSLLNQDSLDENYNSTTQSPT